MTENTYDKNDIVRQVALIRASGLKLAAYRLKDLETGEFSKLQFHATWDNTVMAVMGEEAAKLFATFVRMTVDPAPVEVDPLAKAAPQMLEALKELDAAICEGSETREGRMRLRKALISARAVVAAATGAQS